MAFIPDSDTEFIVAYTLSLQKIDPNLWTFQKPIKKNFKLFTFTF